MDVLKILKESGKDLYLEDLDFFETELAIDDSHDDAYRKQCFEMINTIRKWLKGEDKKNDDTSNDTESSKNDNTTDGVKPQNGETPRSIIIGIENLAPKKDNQEVASLSQKQIILNDINKIREEDCYKNIFKKYVSEKDEIDAAFVDENSTFFKDFELDAIISVKQMGEEFLEKYFGALDHEKIARYQLFSEAFFMKHFNQMDYKIVLENGKNEWRKKANRSNKLDVFLRLKGIKI